MHQFKDCPLVYIPCIGMNLEYRHDIRRLLEILEVDLERLRPITQPPQFDKVILPDESFYLSSELRYTKFTDEYRQTIDRIRHFALKNHTPIANKKFYFFYGGKQIGEERMAEYFKSKGYEVITHEQRFDFDTELNLLINAESFISTIGSVAINSLFLRDNMEAIFIPRWAGVYDNWLQTGIQVHPLNAIYIASTLSVLNINQDSSCFIVSEQLKRFFGDKWTGYSEGDFKTFLEYLTSPVRKNIAINPFTRKMYGSVFEDFLAQLKRRKDLIAFYDLPKDWDTFRPILTYQTHVHMRGWNDGWKFENQSSNPLDQKLEILAIALKYPSHKLYYSVYFSDKEGWSPEVMAPEMACTVDNRKSIYGMRVRLDEDGSKEFNILYRMHKFDDTWTPWAKNGENLYSYGDKLNAIQIKLEANNA